MHPLLQHISSISSCVHIDILFLHSVLFIAFLLYFRKQTQFDSCFRKFYYSLLSFFLIYCKHSCGFIINFYYFFSTATRLSRHGTLLTRQEGKLHIKSASRHARSYGIPIDPECSCSTCQHYDRAYLNHLLKASE